MTCVQIAGLASAILGAIGTIILFFASFSLQPLEGAVWGGPADDAYLQAEGKLSGRIRQDWLAQHAVAKYRVLVGAQIV